jgi:hypothetical protein
MSLKFNPLSGTYFSFGETYGLLNTKFLGLHVCYENAHKYKIVFLWCRELDEYGFEKVTDGGQDCKT